MSEHLTDAELDEIEARAEKATEGPWVAECGSSNSPCIDFVLTENIDPRLDDRASIAETYTDEAENADFIASARTDVPRLVAEVRRLRAQVERLTVPLGESVARTLDKRLAETIRERDEVRAVLERVEALHRPVMVDIGQTGVCEACYELAWQVDHGVSEEDPALKWPCPTISALRGEVRDAVEEVAR